MRTEKTLHKSFTMPFLCWRGVVGFFLFTLFLYSCSESVSYSTSTSDKIAFSEDTVRFDTLISTIGSATKTMSVYNRNKDALRITHVQLGKGLSSPFRVNVDGQYLYGGVGEDFEIRKNDSIVVRIEVTPPQVGSNEILTFSDVLTFRLESGIVQNVVLTAGSIDAYIIHGFVIDCDSTLFADKPYVIYDSLVVHPAAKLTLLPGTRLLFHDGASMEVYGSVDAEGTLDKPVIFRGDRMDHMFDYLLYDNTPNRWEGINLHRGSKNNIFVNCDIHSGSYGIICDSTTVEENLLYIENTIIHNLGGDGLRLNNCVAQVVNSQISNTLGTCVYIFGGAYQFLHCTIAQFYPFDADRGDALYIANQVDGNYRDLYYSYFVNCVITGYGDDVIMGSIVEGQDYTCDYLFHHCYLNTVVSEDTTRFSRIIYDTEDQPLQGSDNFQTIDTHNFIYDFTPDSLSTIRSLADTTYVGDFIFDRLGRSRMADGAPDAGCYEYVEP